MTKQNRLTPSACYVSAITSYNWSRSTIIYILKLLSGYGRLLHSRTTLLPPLSFAAQLGGKMWFSQDSFLGSHNLYRFAIIAYEIDKNIVSKLVNSDPLIIFPLNIPIQLTEPHFPEKPLPKRQVKSSKLRNYFMWAQKSSRKPPKFTKHGKYSTIILN